MKLAVVLVGIQGDENLGYTARAMANFGFRELVLVEPLANKGSGEAKSRAMHAKAVLQKARVCGGLKAALEACGADYSVATTSKTTPEHKLSRTALSAHEFAERFAGTNAKVAIVLGRETSGLTNREIAECDFIVEIPSSRGYAALNVSHAAALLLYEIFIANGNAGKRGKRLQAAKKQVKAQAVKKFAEIAELCGSVKNKRATTAAFGRLVARAPITGVEANAVLAVLSGALAGLGKPGKNPGAAGFRKKSGKGRACKTGKIKNN